MSKVNFEELAKAHEEAQAEVSFKPLFATASPDRCIPSGCTLLNLVLSGRVDGGWLKGRIARVIGDSDTGKTLLCLSTEAEVANNPAFKDYKCLFDDAEASNEFDMTQWGALADRMEAPGDEASFYIEEFFGRVHRLLESKTPFVYTLDSMDALESKASMELFETNQKKLLAGKDLDGSYGDGKAKINSQDLRKVKASLRNTESLLLIISQTRDSMSVMTFGDGKTTAGGKALKFYSCYQVWLAKKEDMTREINGIRRKIGTLVRVRVDKNHATGKHLDFDMPMYYGWGIDDERCSIRWMLEQKVLTKRGTGILCPWTNEAFNEKQLANAVRSDPRVKADFMKYLQEAWDKIEAQVRRPCRYSEDGQNENDVD